MSESEVSDEWLGIKRLLQLADARTGHRFPSIVMSRRFRKGHRAASAPLQGRIEGAVHDLVNRIRADRRQFMRQYDRHKQVSGVIEVDVTGAHRLLAHWNDPFLHLLDVGDHDVVPRYDDGKFFLDKLQRLAPPASFWPEGEAAGLRFFVRKPCLAYAEYGPEQQAEWIYFLSQQQQEVVDGIVLNHVDALRQGQRVPPSFIVGGPGTGKTSVLVNLLKEFTDFEIDARIALSAPLLQYINACIPDAEIDRFVITDEWLRQGDHAEVVLVDDPDSQDEIETWLRSGAHAVIVAFDPCQLGTFNRREGELGVPDEDFQRLCSSHDIDPSGLDVCYRQKANVGQAAKNAMDMIADSTPFLKRSRIEEFQRKHFCLTKLSNGLTFPNPHGYMQVYQSELTVALDKELRRIREKPLWTHWYPVLTVMDKNVELLANSLINIIKQHVQTLVVNTERLMAIKGLEAQHVFLFLGQDLFRQLESGFEGSGQQVYANRRLLRIPYSRAKDSLVVFVV